MVSAGEKYIFEKNTKKLIGYVYPKGTIIPKGHDVGMAERDRYF